MMQHERSLIVSRICSGYCRIKINDVVYKLFSPNKDILYEAEEVFTETYKLAESENLLDEKDIYDILCDMGKWDDKLEIKLNTTIPNYIENAKVELFENFNDKEKRETIRKYLKRAETEQQNLFELRHSFDHFSRHGTASFSKTQYLINACLSEPCNSNSVLSWLNDNFVTETQMREVSRTSPWREMYSFKKLNNVFTCVTSEYSDEQKRLSGWSMLYDSIFESGDNTVSEDVINDDNACDGFLIKRRRNDKSQQVKNEFQDRLDSHKNASDVFIPMNKDELERASCLNGPTEKLIIANRLALINKLGTVSDEQFSDVKIGLEMARNNAGRKSG